VLSVDEHGRALRHADMLPARYGGLRDQVRDFLTGELEAGSTSARGWSGCSSVKPIAPNIWAATAIDMARSVHSSAVSRARRRLGSVLAGKDG
jgi:hypothetical protein